MSIEVLPVIASNALIAFGSYHIGRLIGTHRTMLDCLGVLRAIDLLLQAENVAQARKVIAQMRDTFATPGAKR